MENSLATIGGFCCGTSFVVDHQVCLLRSQSNHDVNNRRDLKTFSLMPNLLLSQWSLMIVMTGHLLSTRESRHSTLIHFFVHLKAPSPWKKVELRYYFHYLIINLVVPSKFVWLKKIYETCNIQARSSWATCQKWISDNIIEREKLFFYQYSGIPSLK